MRIPLRRPNRLLFVGDLFLIIVCVIGSFALRLPLGPLFVYYLPQALVMIAIALVIKPVVYYLFSLYRRVWAYASMRELKLIIAAVSTASVVVALIVVLLTPLELYRGFPRGVLAIDWLLSLVAVGGLRFSVRLVAESRTSGGERPGPRLAL